MGRESSEERLNYSINGIEMPVLYVKKIQEKSKITSFLYDIIL